MFLASKICWCVCCNVRLASWFCFEFFEVAAFVRCWLGKEVNYHLSFSSTNVNNWSFTMCSKIFSSISSIFIGRNSSHLIVLLIFWIGTTVETFYVSGKSPESKISFINLVKTSPITSKASQKTEIFTLSTLDFFFIPRIVFKMSSFPTVLKTESSFKHCSIWKSGWSTLGILALMSFILKIKYSLKFHVFLSYYTHSPSQIWYESFQFPNNRLKS
jgi:hypothetical protein